MTLQKVTMQFQIEFEKITHAEIIMKSLEPEIITSPSLRTSVNFLLDGKKLNIDISAQDATSLRASINSYLRWIMLSLDVINLKNYN